MNDNIGNISGCYLDKLGASQSIDRESYGRKASKKPNDHCKWQQDLSGKYYWEESDAHYRTRIINEAETKER